MSLVTGIHHITVCASGAQEDVDFQTTVAGQRLIKQTVLFDGRYAHYHLYYSNAGAEPGSVTTSFPYNRVPGRQGSGQISSTGYTVPQGRAEILGRSSESPQGQAQRYSGAIRAAVYPLLAPLRLADGSDRRFR